MFDALAINVKNAINNAFYNQEKKQYGNNTVTANILPLAFDMVAADAREAVFKSIVDKTMIENNGHISTGVIGTQWLMRWLTQCGRADIAYRLASSRTYPGWGYMAENGATTIWELWNGNTANPRMNSQNHVMLLGDLIVWFYENLAGIKSSETATGYKRIIMKPSIIDGLNFVNASYHSMHGLIKSYWKKDSSSFTWDITVPGNTTAEVCIPATSVNEVMEDVSSASASEGVKFLKMENGNAVFELGSGEFHFKVSKQ